ncbi:hypothetical protein Pcinc_035162 [Petrolisthes cinctipes]|uniref:Letm1 RBD domain-containing protein n=1 Tax=Petrolisthes cinctipes TaxID=88211 RepID=A0AAE1EPX3_PETCI|nr:hypothetical protein Pcinc_035162 [Petrolisthes cinctipes]
MLLRTHKGTFYSTTQLFRCSRWCLFHGSQTSLYPAYFGSHVLVRPHSTITRTNPYTSCLCYNSLSIRDTNHCISQHARCSIHSVSFLNIQKKLKTKLYGEDFALERDESGMRKIYSDKRERDSEFPYDTKPNISAGIPGGDAKVASESDNVNEDRKPTTRTEQTPPSQGDDVPSSIEKKNNRIMEKEELPSSKVQRYFLWRYSWYLKKFQESLKQEMPDTFKMFHIFTVGVKEFVIDFKDFIKVLMIMSLPGSSLKSLSHYEMLLYYQMPGDMLRVFPVLLLSSVPFGQNIAFPIGYWFPRHLLCRHFWDIQQRHEFAVMAIKKRLFNARPVFRCLQASLYSIADKTERKTCRNVFFKLGSGIHPSTEEIISLIPLFKGEPFNIRSIRTTHVNGLLRLHGRSVWGLRRRRLTDHARLLHCMDAALSTQPLTDLSLDTLRTCLFLRGLNPANMSTAAMLEFMESWLSVSKKVDKSCYSLLLHLPILLTYNQPSNILLIY